MPATKVPNNSFRPILSMYYNSVEKRLRLQSPAGTRNGKRIAKPSSNAAAIYAAIDKERPSMRRCLTTILMLFCVSCSTSKPTTTTTSSTNSGTMDFDKLTDDFLYGSLVL